MGLVLTRSLLKDVVPARKDASIACISVPKDKLSLPYELPNGTIVIGRIEKIEKIVGELTEEERKAVEELLGKEISFVLWVRSIGSEDTLYISKESWPLLRDYGILPDEYKITVKLLSAEVNERAVKIYPRRDVHA